MGQTFRLIKGSALTKQEGDDNLRYPYLWNTANTYSSGMMVFDGSDFWYLCILNVTIPSTIPLSNATYWKKITVSQSLSFDNLSDVATAGAVNGSTIKYNGSSWAVDNTAIVVSYSQLVTLISSNLIIEGAWYKMEYQNKHNFPGTSSVYTGSIEHLLILGVAPNKISGQVFSVEFPTDQIFYDISNNLCGDSVTSRSGYIISRTDMIRSISFPFDFRNTKSRRYKNTTASWVTATSYSIGNCVVNSGILYGCRKAHTSTASFSTDLSSYWQEIIKFSSNTCGLYIVPSSVASLPGYSLGGYTITYNVGDYLDYNTLESISNSRNINVGSSLLFETGDLIIGQNATGILISKECCGITIGSNCEDVTLGKAVKGVFIGTNVGSSSIDRAAHQIVLADNSFSNIVGDNCYSIAFGTYSLNNKVYSGVYNSGFDFSCSGCEITQSNGIRLGQINSNVLVYQSVAPFYTAIFCSNLKLHVTNGSFGQFFTDSEVLFCSNITTGDNCYNSNILKSSTVVIGSGTKLIQIEDSTTVNIGANCEDIKVIARSVNVNVPPSSISSEFNSCNDFTYTSTPVIQQCKFISAFSIALSASLTNCQWLIGVGNKTITADFLNVAILAKSSTAVTWSVATTGLTFDMLSPNGKIWANSINNSGVVTTQSLL